MLLLETFQYCGYTLQMSINNEYCDYYSKTNLYIYTAKSGNLQLSTWLEWDLNKNVFR